VAFPDAGACHDPFVVGLDDFLQIRVGHHLGRNVPGYTRDFCREAVDMTLLANYFPNEKN